MIRPSVIGPTGIADLRAGVGHLLAAGQALGRVHRDRADGVLAEMLGDLEDEAVAVVVGLERGQDRRQLAVERHVDDGADHLADAADIVGGAAAVPCFVVAAGSSHVRFLAFVCR